MSAVGTLAMRGVADNTAITSGLQGTGDSLSPGTPVGTALTVVETGSGNLAPVNGYPIMKMVQVSSTQSNFPIALGSLTAITMGFVVTMPASWPASGVNVLQLRTASAAVMSLVLGGTGSPGQFRFQNSAGVITNGQSATAVATLSHQYYGEIYLSCSASATAGRCRMWDLGSYTANTDITPNTPTWDSRTQNGGTDATAIWGATAITNLLVGTNTAGVLLATMGFGLFNFNNATALTLGGPLAAPAGTAMTRWSGSTEVPLTMKRWNGTSEDPLTMSRA